MTEERWDHRFHQILREVLSRGGSVVGGKSGSVGTGRETLELLTFQFTLNDPRDRILWNPARRFNLYTAIARFVWMLSGSDRLSDIAFYEPKALGFSDDAVTVPGSNYGTRLFMPEPGLDQIEKIVELIKRDPQTRRAAAAIYKPEDTGRDSKDVPCAFGLSFHVRDSRLHMTMMMRSNAAWGLLPFNVFEFTLLGELVSVMTGIPLGTYTHFALSMHIYKSPDKSDEVAKASAAVGTILGDLPAPMGAMPPTTAEDLRRIKEWEARLRFDSNGLNVTNFRDYIARAKESVPPYWTQMCLPLLAYVLFARKKISAGMKVLEEVIEPMRSSLLENDIVRALNIPGLEEDPVLLESRLNLLRYAESSGQEQARREALWRQFEGEYTDSLQTAGELERRRQPALSEREWARRNEEYREPRLF